MLGVHPGVDGGSATTASMPGFLAALHVDPDSGIGAVVLANANDRDQPA